MNNIITFYSYKGGVGRSMSLANVSILLNKWGYRVLIVDWDLEAPGLEHFFRDFIDLEIIKNKIGIINLLNDSRKYSWQDAVITISVDSSKTPIHFISSGLRDESYFKKVRDFSVDDFYETGGGIIIENLRDEWKKYYDFILIDSRTGITEIGGICTVQLPDKIVLLFTATEQGFEGTLDIAKRATKAQQKLPFDRQKLLFIPIPTKFDVQAEYKLSQHWLDIFAKDLLDIYKIWLPILVNPRDFLEKTKIPYVSYFSFGEKLPVIEQGTNDPTGLGYAYENLAALIASDLEQVESLIFNRDRFIEKVQIDNVLIDRLQKAKKSNTTVLDLSYLELTEIPSDISKLIQLTELNLSGNQLADIKGLEQLTQLTELNLGKNQLTKIKDLKHLTHLTKLDLSDNQLADIKGLEQLTQLTQLDLSDNRLADIKGLEQLNKLVELNLSGNQLVEITGVKNLTQITQLRLSSNRLTDIKGLEQLSQLTQLDLSGNQLTEIPEYLLTLGQPIYWKTNYGEKGIYVETNPFTNPPLEIIIRGNQAVEEYFNQRKKSGTHLLNEAKIILLGDARSGKTTFVNRLLSKNMPTETDQTKGVDIVIGEYNFPIANGGNFKINIWDFAGQEKYKPMDQLFYTDSTLYVMVAEAGNNTTDYDDWFQTVAVFGEGSPLIMVLNEFKEGSGMSSFDSTYWKKQFPDVLKEVFTVNLATKQNFSNVEECIQSLVQTLPHTKYLFPSNWAAIRSILNERRNEQYITLKEYLEICKDNDLPERESALILSSVLHKIGVCLHYQKSELLKQFIILKNEWATDAVYKILDDKIVAEQKCGFFDHSDMERIWDSDEYFDMRPHLLELMKQLKLAYQLPGKEEFVTPPLLPLSKPEGFLWPEFDSLEIYIVYDFLPKALLTQFIVTRHADIAESRTMVWRHGVILEWKNEALAEVSKTKLQGRNAFQVRTQGNNRKGMMTVILKTFRDLHAEYKGIKYKEKVPCTCEGCITGKNKQHYFDFDNLNFRLENGRYEVECDQSLKPVNIIELLENTFDFEQFKEGSTLQLKEKVFRESYTHIRVLNLFLVSSNELRDEREKIEQVLSRKNKSLRKQGFLIDLLIWEDDQHIDKSVHSQDDYNIKIKQCDLFVMLFYSKVGKYSFEEFEIAISLFKNKGIPRICVFQKDIDLPKKLSKTDADSRFAFLERLQKIEHFPIPFGNPDKLINELEDCIDKLLLDEDFVKGLKVE
jgi:internalin A